MSKSLGNFVNTPEVFDKYGADAARQWAAAGGSTGTDIPFRWQDVEYGYRFMRKFWNACRFASMRLEDYQVDKEVAPRLLDRWISSKLEKAVRDTTLFMEECQFMNATDAARNFIWHTFCDHYLEAAKHRLYGEGDEKTAAQQTLHYAVKRMLKIMAPVIPHLSEEIYSNIYNNQPGESIHTSKWPEVNEGLIDPVAERRGDLIISLISAVRKEKNRMGISLNTPIKVLTIQAKDEEKRALEEGTKDIAETLKVEELEFTRKTCEHTVEEYPEMGFTINLEV
jgi:valyl-tRNA synthetase